MKHLLNSILASSLILSMATVSFASELPETQNISAETEVLQEIETKTLSSMSPEVASAYAGVIENIIQTYGENPTTEYLVNETGLIMARLVDFDGDGVEELYVSYVSKTVEFDDPGPIHCGKYITEEIWAYTGSGAKKLWTEEYDFELSQYRSNDVTGLLFHEGSYVLVKFLEGITNKPYGNYTFYDYVNGEMTKVDYITVSINDPDMVWSVNGVKTTEKVVYGETFFDEYTYNNRLAFARYHSKYDMNNLEMLGYNSTGLVDSAGQEFFGLFWTYQNCLPQLQAIASQPSTKTATPSTAKVMVNGELVNFGAYNIDGFNFYKLTDMSYALSGTGKQFEVTWDGDIGAINMKIGSPHIVKGTELQGTSGTDKIAEEMDVKVLKNSALVNDLIVYSIDGSSYFQLDKLKGELGIDVGWDGVTSTITITT